MVVGFAADSSNGSRIVISIISYNRHSNVVLRPKTTLEVSKAVKYCNDNFIPISVQGGNTGLVGGSVPVNNE
ncbi:D-2-hydroxyglutarate dehydrogenase, mitochondrial, partial [Perkinsus olseni]